MAYPVYPNSCVVGCAQHPDGFEHPPCKVPGLCCWLLVSSVKRIWCIKSRVGDSGIQNNNNNNKNMTCTQNLVFILYNSLKWHDTCHITIVASSPMSMQPADWGWHDYAKMHKGSFSQGCQTDDMPVSQCGFLLRKLWTSRFLQTVDVHKTGDKPCCIFFWSVSVFQLQRIDIFWIHLVLPLHRDQLRLIQWAEMCSLHLMDVSWWVDVFLGSFWSGAPVEE